MTEPFVTREMEVSAASFMFGGPWRRQELSNGEIRKLAEWSRDYLGDAFRLDEIGRALTDAFFNSPALQREIADRLGVASVNTGRELFQSIGR